MERRDAAPGILSVVGCKHAGKTRACEILIPLFRASGLHVGTLKYSEHEGFDWDRAGTDTFRHYAAGSEITGIFGRQVLALQSNVGEDRQFNPRDMVPVLFRGVDLVLVEGYQEVQALKIEVCRPGFSDRPVVIDQELLATYGVNLFDRDRPHFDYGKEQSLAELIRVNLHRLRTA
jgi:molybdopterin-guanine dinucleotide biosynthesis protein MobB